MGGRKPGTPKTGGRKPGTPNKESKSLLSKCESLGVDPFDEMIKLCREGVEPGIRMSALKEVCQYLYPKRKSLEHSANLDPKMMEAAEELDQMTKQEKIEMLEEELERLKG